MRLMPIIKCRDLSRSIAFYTQVLDFVLVDPTDTSPVIELANGDAFLQLSTMSGDSVFGVAINVLVDDVDARFQTYLSRGLDVAAHLDSPVHQSPVDQTWGTRELYVTDSDGNTLRFRQPIGQ
jgi:catechol 2,3-dioxygenase-like lactoylglutathione lyase family enzyme